MEQRLWCGDCDITQTNLYGAAVAIGNQHRQHTTITTTDGGFQGRYKKRNVLKIGRQYRIKNKAAFALQFKLK